MVAVAAGAHVGAAETAEVVAVLKPPRAAKATVATPARWLSLRNTDKEILHDQVMGWRLPAPMYETLLSPGSYGFTPDR
jgi:hypothetical protein